MFRRTVSPENAPDQAEMIEIAFEKGDPVAVNGIRLSPANLLEKLNELGGKHGIGRRITSYNVCYTKLLRDEAYRVQKDYFHRYGTSLRGLMAEHGLDPEDYLTAVHDIDYGVLAPDPALAAALRIPAQAPSTGAVTSI